MNSSLDTFDPERPAGITAAQLRSAGVTLADQSLLAAGLDEEAAAEPLRETLQAIGAYPYEAAERRTRHGQPVAALRSGREVA